ncbi:MAG: hypothetical protein Q4D14_00815 [Bacteroidales bacterium]|nr:hypothetical protein [Bacteroidales bacterium]
MGKATINKHHIPSLFVWALVGLYSISLVACDSFTHSSIPDYPVTLDINLTADAPELIPVLGYKTFIEPQKISQQLGYGGILIYHTVNVEGCPYVAFDLACPHEANAEIRLHVNTDGTAECDSCHSIYMLLDGTGFATSGPAKEKLRKYSVSQIADNLYIRR